MQFLRSRNGQIILGIVGVVAVALVITLIVWISLSGAWPLVRDIALVVLALVSLVPLLALSYAVFEVARTALALKKELVPVLDELRETTHTLRQTARVANDFTVKPAVKTASFMMGFSQATSVILGQGNARKRQADRRRKYEEAKARGEVEDTAPEADHVDPR
ncbi:MAG: hypothetical protein H0X24_04925 [Ktedonobacterales bacterium]|nr:hypothetical protein [Ktedonobacterales bacterium]